MPRGAVDGNCATLIWLNFKQDKFICTGVKYACLLPLKTLGFFVFILSVRLNMSGHIKVTKIQLKLILEGKQLCWNASF